MRERCSKPNRIESRIKANGRRKMPADSNHFEYIAPNFNTNLLCINSMRELRERTLVAERAAGYLCFVRFAVLVNVHSLRERNMLKRHFSKLCYSFAVN